MAFAASFILREPKHRFARCAHRFAARREQMRVGKQRQELPRQAGDGFGASVCLKVDE